MNVGCCIVPSKGNRCITHDIVAIIIAFPPVSVDVGRPFGAPVEWSSRPSGKGYNKGVTVIFDIVGKNVLTLDARCYRTLGTIRLLFFAGSSSIGPITFRLKIIMDQNGGQPILLATSPTPKTAFLVSSWTISSWSVCLSQDVFFWSDPECLSGDV
jgi:hypothetical protein